MQLKSLDGETVLQDKNHILDRFAEHFNWFPNVPRMRERRALYRFTQRPIMSCLDEPPDEAKFIIAVAVTKKIKSTWIMWDPSRGMKVWRSVATKYIIFN